MNQFVSEPVNVFSMPSTPPPADIQSLYSQVEQLQAREKQIMELIGCDQPKMIIHDLRNLLNELQLLKIITREMRQ